MSTDDYIKGVGRSADALRPCLHNCRGPSGRRERGLSLRIGGARDGPWAESAGWLKEGDAIFGVLFEHCLAFIGGFPASVAMVPMSRGDVSGHATYVPYKIDDKFYALIWKYEQLDKLLMCRGGFPIIARFAGVVPKGFAHAVLRQLSDRIARRLVHDGDARGNCHVYGTGVAGSYGAVFVL
ncbi:hypothetical protein EVAR_12468_1 [Eumeta japonica]|uniref:Uncharacterized protein n=1 Tax=Eumeta variegata TaxID=151549 RepID=A0A4C1TPG6_EUMVA|nr:hypothetical protein EVAR_12468_1 [Eumeta japonica]